VEVFVLRSASEIRHPLQVSNERHQSIGQSEILNKSNEKQKNNQIVSYFSQTHMCISKYMGLRLGVGVENAIRHFGDVVADSNVPIPRTLVSEQDQS